MLGDFQAKFHVEPDISVRLIEPSQCEVTNFLRFLGQTAADKPQLVLDRTSVPDGTPISGTLVTHGGLISSVLLIDHKGMAFNLDDRIVAQSDKATFSIPIGLGAADKAAGKAVPQIIHGDHRPAGYSGGAFSDADASLGAAAQNSRGDRDRRIASSPPPPSISGSADSMGARWNSAAAFVSPACRPAHKAA